MEARKSPCTIIGDHWSAGLPQGATFGAIMKQSPAIYRYEPSAVEAAQKDAQATFDILQARIDNELNDGLMELVKTLGVCYIEALLVVAIQQPGLRENAQNMKRKVHGIEDGQAETRC